MAAFESQKKSARLLVLAPNKQSAYGTALVDSKFTAGWQQRFDGSGVLDMTPTKRTDKNMAGKGTEFATNEQTTGWDTKVSFKSDADARLLGWIFGFLLGKDTVTGAGPYVHTMAFDESTTQALATSIWMEDTAAISRVIYDLAMSDVTLTIPERGALSVEAAMIGTGRFTNHVITTIPTLDQPTYVLGSDCALTIGPVGSLASVVGRHLTSSLKFSTGVVNHTAPGAGLYGVFPRTGLRKFSFQTTIAAMATDDISTLLENDTQCGATFTINSGASAQIVISFPAFNLKANKLGFKDNMVIWQIESDESLILNPSGAGPFSVVVTNGVPTYLGV